MPGARFGRDGLNMTADHLPTLALSASPAVNGREQTVLDWGQALLAQIPAELEPEWRDLAWLWLSPDLLARPLSRAYAWPAAQVSSAVQQFLTQQQARCKHEVEAQSEQDRSQLREFITAAGMRRLGLYAERLLQFDFARQQMLLAHGLQVQRGKQTLGEFDFVLKADAETCWHLELACKFYLCVPRPDTALSLFDYLGPNLADSLGAKLKKIQQAQLQLADYPEAQQLLKASAGSDLAGAFAHIKGCLFYRPADLSLSVPDQISPQHARGLILELDELLDLPVRTVVTLARLEWLAPRTWQEPQVQSLEMAAQALQAHWQIQANPQMLAIVQNSGTSWHEVLRVFVIPPGWWQRAQSLVRSG